MKSQELRQIHTLLYEVRNQLTKDAHKNGISLILTGNECTLQSNPPPETNVVLTAQQ